MPLPCHVQSDAAGAGRRTKNKSPASVVHPVLVWVQTPALPCVPALPGLQRAASLGGHRIFLGLSKRIDWGGGGEIKKNLQSQRSPNILSGYWQDGACGSCYPVRYSQQKTAETAVERQLWVPGKNADEPPGSQEF